MPINTPKAIRERRAKAIAELNDVNDQLDAAEPGSDEYRTLNADYDKRLEAIEEMDAKLQRAERMDGLKQSLSSGEAGGGDGVPGSEDRDFDSNTESDDIIANLDNSQYSVLRAVRSLMDGREVRGYEGEISQELERRFDKNCNGFIMPWNLRCDLSAIGGAGIQRRDLDTTAGAGAIATNQAPTMIQMLRNRVVLRQMGATVLSDLVGNFEIPKETGAPTFAWTAEAAAAAKSNGTIGNVSFNPKTVTAWTQMSRRFMKQTSVDAENFARYQLITGLSRATDYGGLAGPGTANNVTGLINNTDTNLVAMGTNGGDPSWAKVVEMETVVAADNADIGTMGYVVNAVTRGKMKTVEKSAGTAKYLWDDNEINGYGAMASNQLPSNLTKGSASGVCSAGLFGDFSQLILGFWGGADILVDPYSGAPEGNVRVVIHQDMDVQNRHDEAFARVVDFLTA